MRSLIFILVTLFVVAKGQRISTQSEADLAQTISKEKEIVNEQEQELRKEEAIDAGRQVGGQGVQTGNGVIVTPINGQAGQSVWGGFPNQGVQTGYPYQNGYQTGYPGQTGWGGFPVQVGQNGYPQNGYQVGWNGYPNGQQVVGQAGYAQGYPGYQQVRTGWGGFPVGQGVGYG